MCIRDRVSTQSTWGTNKQKTTNQNKNKNKKKTKMKTLAVLLIGALMVQNINAAVNCAVPLTQTFEAALSGSWQLITGVRSDVTAIPNFFYQNSQKTPAGKWIVRTVVNTIGVSAGIIDIRAPANRQLRSIWITCPLGPQPIQIDVYNTNSLSSLYLTLYGYCTQTPQQYILFSAGITNTHYTRRLRIDPLLNKVVAADDLVYCAQFDPKPIIDTSSNKPWTCQHILSFLFWHSDHEFAFQPTKIYILVNLSINTYNVILHISDCRGNDTLIVSELGIIISIITTCLLYTSPSPRDQA
eukprot:TRINITY_DN2864_c0_g1_i1.p1 TRINITY_DN2864_c0_g1~~TRINITY_DN2864_c0_g1_i1.p1  ORF type:complete len:298 (-),score=43.67 TRINITY_DN2864_c0_g1_i1:74-967(-)